MSETDKPDRPPLWRTRTLILLGVGAVAAWLVWWVMGGDSRNWSTVDPARMSQRMATATAVSVMALAFGFGLERVRARWTAIFAIGLGLVAGLVLYWNNDPEGLWSWCGWSLFLAIAIAVPLFQVARDEGRWSFPYTQIHGHAWTNVVLWFACWAFAGIAMLLVYLLSELFHLIGIELLYDLLSKHGWFPAMIVGGSFGAALGMLRDLDHVVRLLQRVVTIVLSVLAPVLAVGLVLFLLSVPITGLGKLWEATRSATPILISCVIGALVLINAVVGHGAEDEAKNPVLRWAAMALGATILPLAIVASIATGLRINQYGFTPERLWALVVVVLATVYGVVYLAALVRRRQDWAIQLRPDNTRLAFAMMVVALVLATPIVGFNAISVNDQVAKLKSGKVSVERFDWAALAFDFGKPGRDALEGLRKSFNPAIAARAATVLKVEHRWDLSPYGVTKDTIRVATYDIKPAGAVVPDQLKVLVTHDLQACSGSTYCRIYMQSDGKTAIAVGDGCMALPPEKRSDPASKCVVHARAFVLSNGKWIASDEIAMNLETMIPDQDRAALQRERAAIDAGRVELRDVTEKQLFIGDKSVGRPFKQP